MKNNQKLIITQYIIGAVIISLIGMYCIVIGTSLSKRAVLIDLESKNFENQSRTVNNLLSKSISDAADLSIDSHFVSLIKKTKLTNQDMDTLFNFLSKASDNNNNAYTVDICLIKHDLTLFGENNTDIIKYQNINSNVLDKMLFQNARNSYWKDEHNLKYPERIIKVISYVQPIQLSGDEISGAVIINYDINNINKLLNNNNNGSSFAFMSRNFKDVYSLMGSPVDSSSFRKYVNIDSPVVKSNHSFTVKDNNMFMFSNGNVTDIALVKLIEKDYFTENINNITVVSYIIIFFCCLLITLAIFSYIYISFIKIAKFKGGPIQLSNVIKEYEQDQKFITENADSITNFIYNTYIGSELVNKEVINYIVRRQNSNGSKIITDVNGFIAAVISFKDGHKFEEIKPAFIRELKDNRIQLINVKQNFISILFEIKSPLLDEIEINERVKTILTDIYTKLCINSEVVTFMGSAVSSIEHISGSLDEALKLYDYLYYVKRGSFIMFRPIDRNKNANSLIEFPSYSKLVYAINKNSMTLCTSYILKIFEYISSTNMTGNSLINSLLINLFNVLTESFSKQLSLVVLQEIENIIEELATTAYTKDELNDMLNDVVTKVINSIHSQDSESSSFTKVLDYIHANYNKDLSLNELADMFGVAAQYFSKVFKDNMGTTLVLYLTDLRLNKALELLEKSDKLVKDIATEVGYSNPQYFIRVFKKKFKISPLKFKRQSVADEELV